MTKLREYSANVSISWPSQFTAVLIWHKPPRIIPFAALASIIISVCIRDIKRLWIILLSLTVAILENISGKNYSEKLIVSRSLGVQIERRLLPTGKKEYIMIDRSDIQDVVVTEAFDGFHLVSYLSILSFSLKATAVFKSAELNDGQIRSLQECVKEVLACT